MKTLHLLLVVPILLLGASSASALDFVSVNDKYAILYDAPSAKAKKKFIVNRHMPLEQVVTLEDWVKVRDSKGGLFWIEKRQLSNKRYVFALNPLIDVHTTADENSPRIFQVRQQVALEFLESNHAGWIKIRHADGETGFVRSNDVWGD